MKKTLATIGAVVLAIIGIFVAFLLVLAKCDDCCDWDYGYGYY